MKGSLESRPLYNNLHRDLTEVDTCVKFMTVAPHPVLSKLSGTALARDVCI